jgi:hypothetical protein
VERKTGFAIVKKLKARNKEEVTKAALRAIQTHSRQFKTLTLDNGTEFHNYAVLEERFPLRSTSLRLTTRGKEAPMKTSTACCGSTYPKECACARSRRPNAIRYLRT